MVEEIIFGSEEPGKKLELIAKVPESELLSFGMEEVMKRIIKECADEDGDFRISNKRREGNDWNSLVEGIRMYDGKVVVDVYIQGGNTDTMTSESYSDLLMGTGKSYTKSHIGSAYYDKDSKVNVVRSLLSEYVYQKHIEKDERERAKKAEELLHWSVINPVVNHYFNEWRLKYDDEMHPSERNRLYHRCDKALREYIRAHVDELYGMTKEELIEEYHRIWKSNY